VAEETEIPMETDDDRFASNVRLLRERHGWSQGELAKRLQEAGHDQFHATTISRIEKGDRGVRLGEARAISRALGSRVSVMVQPTEDMKTLQDFAEDFEAYRKCRAEFADYAVKLFELGSVLRRSIDAARPLVGRVEWIDPEMRTGIQSMLTSAENALKMYPVDVAQAALDDEYGPSREDDDGER
jgi:transcriptional regulator with XRE-family HTH domain